MFTEIRVPYGHMIVVFGNQWIAEELNGWVTRQANFFQNVMNVIEPSFTIAITVPTQSTVFSFNPYHFPRYEEFTNYPEIDYSDISSDSLNSLYSLLENTWHSLFIPYAQDNVSPHLSLFDAIPIHHGC